jgi:hypothetical protein
VPTWCQPGPAVKRANPCPLCPHRTARIAHLEGKLDVVYKALTGAARGADARSATRLARRLLRHLSEYRAKPGPRPGQTWQCHCGYCGGANHNTRTCPGRAREGAAP